MYYPAPFGQLQGSPVRKAFVIGSDGLKAMVRAAGVEVVKPQVAPEEAGISPEDMAHVEHDREVGAVIVGFDRGLCYYKLAYATLCILENPGCKFIATNRDL